jgi:hypothetical protein
MRAALAAGAGLINDVRALQARGALEAVAGSGCGVCLMHMQGKPRTMQANPRYDDVVREVRDFLVARALIAEGAGIARDRIAIDPGFGFGKTMAHNLALLRSLRALAGPDTRCWPGCRARRRSARSPAGTSASGWRAASPRRWRRSRAARRIVRVHDVRETVDALAASGSPSKPRRDLPLEVRPVPQRPQRRSIGEQMQRKYFGTDGMRGRVGDAPITPELVMKLGWAAGRTLASPEGARRGDRPGVLIGKDTRISGYLLEAALESGLSAAGVDVYLCGPLPTPGIAYLTRALRLSAGIVVSASHNPYDDNGIKFFSAAGAPSCRTTSNWPSRRGMEEPLACVPSAELGKAFRVADAPGRYVEFCKSTFPNELDLRGWRIVVDCAHGAAYHVAPPVFCTSSAPTWSPWAPRPTASTSTRAPARRTRGSSPTRCAKARRRHRHRARRRRRPPGDGRREGRLYDGDQLLYVIAADYRRRRVANEGVVGTLMSNLGFEQALARPASRSRARRSATATCWSRCRRRAGCWAARTQATSSASTSTRPATASSRRCAGARW